MVSENDPKQHWFKASKNWHYEKIIDVKITIFVGQNNITITSCLKIQVSNVDICLHWKDILKRILKRKATLKNTEVNHQ